METIKKIWKKSLAINKPEIRSKEYTIIIISSIISATVSTIIAKKYLKTNDLSFFSLLLNVTLLAIFIGLMIYYIERIFSYLGACLTFVRILWKTYIVTNNAKKQKKLNSKYFDINFAKDYIIGFNAANGNKNIYLMMKLPILSAAKVIKALNLLAFKSVGIRKPHNSDEIC